MKKEYFEWERQATIHPLLLCMESWIEPTQKYCGRAWPTSYIHYTKDIVFWVNKNEELLDYGNYLLEVYTQEENRFTLEADIKKIAHEFDMFFAHVNSIKLSDVSDIQLLKEYSSLADLFIRWFVPGAFVEPIGLAGEEHVRKMLNEKGVKKDNIDAHISVLTTTPKKTFSKSELEELILCIDGTRSFEEHANKWYWIHNSYFSTDVLSPVFFKEQATLLSKKHGNLKSHVKKSKPILS